MSKHSEYMKQYYKKYPWKKHYNKILQRCENPKCDKFQYYGGKGIKCLVTSEEIKYLWFRDKAYLMEKPSIDRKNNSGNYTLDNCRFIELYDNISKGTSKKVIQYDLEMNKIKEWPSARIAAKKLKIQAGAIGRVCLKRYGYNTAGNSIWRYK